MLLEMMRVGLAEEREMAWETALVKMEAGEEAV